MSAQAKRYETLVVENSTSATVPRTAAGGRVVSWASGHAIAECSAYETFVADLIDGAFLDLEEALEAAQEAWEQGNRQREQGYD
ncbi:hypothetical protein EC849_11682 [Pseudomonas putida]|uniref:hypothetical protein n=1 Tax=Pseudomonas putida TaxID=303 RepID=UPI00104305FD|nr:hypothetical protein [Pseudomonas putida]TCP73547.1 hypothetical protein EC849_11682 [Pseudomonas putida]